MPKTSIVTAFGQIIVYWDDGKYRKITNVTELIQQLQEAAGAEAAAKPASVGHYARPEPETTNDMLQEHWAEMVESAGRWEPIREQTYIVGTPVSVEWDSRGHGVSVGTGSPIIHYFPNDAWVCRWIPQTVSLEERKVVALERIAAAQERIADLLAGKDGNRAQVEASCSGVIYNSH